MKTTSSHRAGYYIAVFAAACVSGYVLTARYAFSHTHLSSSTYTAWFFIAAGTLALIDSLFSIGARSTARLFVTNNHINTSVGRLLINGSLATLGFGLLAFGQHHTTATNASVILAGNFVTTIFFSWIVLKRGISRMQFITVFVVLAGLYLAVVGTTSVSLHSGDAIVLAAAIVVGFTNAYMKTLMQEFKPRIIADVRLMTGAVLALIYIAAVHSFNGLSLHTIFYPAVAGMFFWMAVMGITTSVQKLGSNEAIVISQLHILSTPIIAIFLLNEHYRLTTFIGSLIMLAGVIYFARSAPRSSRTKLLAG